MSDEATNYRLREIERRLDRVDSTINEVFKRFDALNQIFVRLERYAIIEKAVIAIYSVLSLAAFGLLWKLVSGS